MLHMPIPPVPDEPVMPAQRPGPVDAQQALKAELAPRPQVARLVLSEDVSEEEAFAAHSEWLERLAEGSGLGWVRCTLPAELGSLDELLFPYGRRVGDVLSFAVTASSGAQVLSPDDPPPSPRVPMIGSTEDLERFQEEFAEWEEATRPLAVVRWSDANVGSEGLCVVEAFDEEADLSSGEGPLGRHGLSVAAVFNALTQDPTLSDAAREDMVAWGEDFERSLEEREAALYDDIDQMYDDLDENQGLLQKMWEAAGLSDLWPSEDLDLMEEEELEWIEEEVEATRE